MLPRLFLAFSRACKRLRKCTGFSYTAGHTRSGSGCLKACGAKELQGFGGSRTQDYWERRPQCRLPVATGRLGIHREPQLAHVEARCTTIDISMRAFGAAHDRMSICPAGLVLVGLRSAAVSVAGLRTVGTARCCPSPGSAVDGECSNTQSRSGSWLLCPLGSFVVGIGADAQTARCCGTSSQRIGRCSQISPAQSGMTQCPVGMLLTGVRKQHPSRLDSADELMCCQPLNLDQVRRHTKAAGQPHASVRAP